MTKATLLIGLIGLSLPATDLTAQEPQPDSATVRAATRTLRSDLRNFITAQERYFADHSTYAPSMRAIWEIYRPSATVTLIVLTGTDRYHSEIAVDERVPGLVCATFVGDAHPPLETGGEGRVTCRGP